MSRLTHRVVTISTVAVIALSALAAPTLAARIGGAKGPDRLTGTRKATPSVVAAATTASTAVVAVTGCSATPGATAHAAERAPIVSPGARALISC